MKLLIEGTITNPKEKALGGILIQAFQIDFKSETLIAETISSAKGQFKMLVESATQLNRFNLLLRAYSFGGTSPLAESTLIIRPTERVQVNLVVRKLIPSNEFDQINAAVALIAPEEDFRDWQQRDIDIFLATLRAQNNVPPQVKKFITSKRIRSFLDSQEMDRNTTIPAAFFYGALRVLPKEWDLQNLLSQTNAELEQLTEKARKSGLVPALNMEEIISQLDRLRIRNQILIRKRLAFQILHETTEQPLLFLELTLIQLRLEKVIGKIKTNSQGVAVFQYLGQEGVSEKFSLEIRDFEGALIHQQQLAEQKALIRIALPFSDFTDHSPDIQELSSSLDLRLPKGLLPFLKDRGINSLQQLLAQGGFERLDGLPSPADHPALQKLEAHAELQAALAAYEPEEVEKLIQANYSDLSSLANSERVSFVSTLGPALGNYKAASLLKQAKASQALLDQLQLSLQTNAIPQDASDGPPWQVLQQEFLEGNGHACDCSSCNTAVAPTAYLADLIRYVENHFQIEEDGGGNPILFSLEDLEQTFYQPFANLPLDCKAADEKVLQLRICTEVLQLYLRNHQLPPANSSQAANFNTAYQYYLETAYEKCLNDSNTSLEELRMVIRSSDPQEMEALSSRMGIPTDRLTAFLVDPQSLSEATLEHVFGLPDTRDFILSRGILLQEDGSSLSSDASPVKQWNLQGVRWNQTTDVNGYIYLSLTSPDVDTFRLEVFRDPARTLLLAAGQIDSAEGLVTLTATPGGNSNLHGAVRIQYSEDVLNLKISAIPLLISGQLEFLYDSFAQQGDTNPLIDPDLLSFAYLQLPLTSNPAYDLWTTRKTLIEEQLQRLREFEPDLEDTDRFPALLNAFNVELNDVVLLPKELEYLTQIQTFLNSPNPAPLFVREWEATYSIVQQVQKRALFNDWTQEELAAGISLVPDFFKLPESEQRIREGLPEWRADLADLRQLENLIMARSELRQGLLDRHESGISEIEQELLPLLKDVLLDATDMPGTSLLEKASALSTRLLINAEMDACLQTTRVAQAIETLQLLAFSIKTGQFLRLHPKWDVLSDQYDEEWKWMGSYASWKSAMMVFLYPENVLHPSLRRQKSAAFEELEAYFRDHNLLTPQDICQLASDYGKFIRELPDLTVEAACQARVQLSEEQNCEYSSSPIQSSYVHFLFARAQQSGQIYMAKYRSGVTSTRDQLSWKRIEHFDNVVQIVGASVYEFSLRFIYLFVKQQEGEGKEKLSFLRYDLDTGSFDPAGVFTLFIQGDPDSFAAHLNQTNNSKRPPALALQVGEHFSLYQFNQEGTNWEPLVGARYVNSNLQPLRLLAMISFDVEETAEFDWPQNFVLIGENSFGVFANMFNPASRFDPQTSYDTGFHQIAFGNFQGATYWPENPNRIYVFYERDGALLYKALYFDRGYQQEPEDVGEGFEGLDIFSDLLHIAVQTSANTGTFDTHQFAFQLEGSEGGPFLGLFEKIPPPTPIEFSTFRNLNTPVAGNSGRGGSLRFRVGLPGQIIGGIDSGILDPGDFDLPPLPPTPPPRPPAPEDLKIRSIDSIRLTPFIDSTVEILPPDDSQDLQIRRALIKQVFEVNELSHPALLIHLEEAFYFVPMLFGLNLQRRGFYLEALSWFRTVYDYTQELDLRKIYFGLVKEEGLLLNYERTAQWLLDPLNPHYIAQVRSNTYSRYTIQVIIRCLLDFADAEFTKDNSESLSRAASLYRVALNLFDVPELARCTSPTDSIKTETGQQLQEWFGNDQTGIQAEILDQINQLQSRVELERVATELEALREREKPFNTLRELSTTLREKVQAQFDIGRLTDLRRAKTFQQRNLLYRQKEVIQAATEVSQLAELDFDNAFFTIGRRSKSELQQLELLWLSQKEKRIPGKKVLLPTTESRSIKHSKTLELVAKDTPNGILLANQELRTGFYPGSNISFCIPYNPVIDNLQSYAKVNLSKLHQCRNIAGQRRDVEPYVVPVDAASGILSLSDSGGIIAPNSRKQFPTLFRFRFLIERARNIASLAQQIESNFLSILERRDSEFYNLLKAKQDLTISFANVRLFDLRRIDAQQGLRIAELQQDMAQMKERQLNEIVNPEKDSLFVLKNLVSVGISVGQIIVGIESGKSDKVTDGLKSLGELFFNDNSEAKAQLAFAKKELEISKAQVARASNRIRIASQELNIANLRASHAQETLEFLVNKFTNYDLFEWMTKILEEVYSTVLQQATAVAQLAMQQLSFERQEPIPRFIQTDYWEAPLSLEADFSSDGNSPDRKGLTGSARLLRDILQLDQYGFDTDQRKQQLTKTISLAQLFPLEFQLFRESGRLIFTLPMSLFDRDFPGHYLRLIKRLRMSLIALIPPGDGIKATLRTLGLSQVVVNDNGVFRSTFIQRLPESISFTSAAEATGQFEFDLQQDIEKLRPFEGNGVAGTWILELPKAANSFDYDTIADILITLDYSALEDDSYKQQVIQQVDQRIVVERAFSFRVDFPDQWFELNNPQLVAAENRMKVRFNTRRNDFPANVVQLSIQQISLYFLPSEGEVPPIQIEHLKFKPVTFDENEPFLGSANQSLETIDHVISTKLRLVNEWTDLLGQQPIGEWELAFENEAPSQLFKAELVKDIMMILTIEMELPPWI